MNRIYFYFILILFPVFLFAESNQHIVSGKWYNPYIDRQIVVLAFPDGIKVKGIHSKYGWTFFDRRGSGTFYDVYGNKIRLFGHDQILYTDRRKKVRLSFILLNTYKNQDRQRYKRGDDKSDYYNKYDQKFSDKEDDFSEQNDHNGNQKYEIEPNDLEGTWKVKDFSKTVYIVETRDGIKARFSDEKKWFTYHRSSHDSAGFVSDEGYQYIYTGDGKLIWIDKTQAKKFYLTKISDQFQD